MSFTRTGFISKGKGGCLVGEKSSLTRAPKPPKPSTQPVESLLSEGPLGTGLLLKKSRKLFQKPAPYSSGIRSDFTSPWILTGRSNRNCLKLDQKSSGMRIAGRPKRGTTGDEPGGEELGRS